MQPSSALNLAGQLLVGLLFLPLTGCGNPAGSPNTNTTGTTTSTPEVTLSGQSASISAGSSGAVTFAATTSNVTAGTVGSLTWYSTAAAASAVSAPGWVSVSISAVTNSAATITLTATAPIAGSYYFKLTEGSAVSAVSTLVISAATSSTSISFASSSGSISSGTTGTATFTATTTNVTAGTVGSLTWYSDAAGTSVTSAPAWISPTITAVTSNSVTLSLTAVSSAVAGSYYFRLTEGTTVSSVITLKVVLTVTYNANSSGATGGVPVDSSGGYTPNTAATVLGTGTLSYSGYTLAGWNTQANGLGTSYAAGSKLTIGSTSVTLYAIWAASSLVFTSSGNDIAITGSYMMSGSLVIPNGVTRIADKALQSCGMDTSVSIPQTVTSIGMSPCYGNTSLTSISVDSNNPNYCSINGFLYDKAGTTLIQAPLAFTGTYTMPSTATTSGAYAFYDGKLTGIVFPTGFTTLQAGVFELSSLSSVTLPASLVSIGDFCFWDSALATAEATITIPANVSSIGGAPFVSQNGGCIVSVASGNQYYMVGASGVLFNLSGSQIVSVPSYLNVTNYTIPSSVTSIANYAFASTSYIGKVTLTATTPPTLQAGSNAFQGTSFNLYVPAAAVATYKSAAGWSDYASRIVSQ